MSRQLPPKPSLEQLKKQAKELHQARASGDPEAIALIRQHLPRLSGASDDQIRQAEVSLQEVQHVLAGEYGFKSWNWLRTIAEPDFDLLAKLTDREIQTLLREVDQKDMVVALKDAGDAVKLKLLGNMSQRVSRFICEEVVFLKDVSEDDSREVQRRILLQTAQLANQGQIDWPTGQAPAPRPLSPAAPRLLELLVRDLDDLSLDEMVALWFEVAEQARKDGILSLEPLLEHCASSFVKEGIILAVDGTEPALIVDILNLRSQRAILSRQETRGRIVIEGMLAIMAGDNPEIIRIKLSALYEPVPSGRGRGAKEVSGPWLVGLLRETPFARLELDEVVELLADIGDLARRDGIEALRPLVQAADAALLRRGLELLLTLDRNDAGRLRELLQAQLDEELRHSEVRHRMAIAGINAVQLGKTPAEVEQAVRQAAAQGTP